MKEQSIEEYNNDEAHVRDVVALWDDAMVSNDINLIGKYMSENWEIIGSDGITTRDSFFHVINSGELTHHTMTSDELQIRIYGQTGIVISRGTSAGYWKGVAFDLYEWSTSIFVKTDGQWLCVLTMVTPAKIP